MMAFTNALKALGLPCYEIVNRQKRAQVGPFPFHNDDLLVFGKLRIGLHSKF